LARLYANENFPLPVVARLRELGHDVLTTQDAGNAGQAIDDPEVLAFAVQEQRAVLTINRRDFIHLHRDKPNHAGIVVCTQDGRFIAQAERIHDEICSAGEIAGRLLRVTRPNPKSDQPERKRKR